MNPAHYEHSRGVKMPMQDVNQGANWKSNRRDLKTIKGNPSKYLEKRYRLRYVRKKLKNSNNK